MTSIQEETDYDSLFSQNSLKTSRSNMHLCTCTSQSNGNVEISNTNDSDLQAKNPHKGVQRVASYPKCHPSLDPHRFDLLAPMGTPEGTLKGTLRHLPTVPPKTASNYFFPANDPSLSGIQTHGKSPRTSALHTLKFPNEQAADEIPPCVRNIILQQLQNPPPELMTNPKMIRKLSKTINLPDDPNDPTAFTVFYNDHPMFQNVPRMKSRSKRSRQVVKIVGTFSFLMTMGIVITVLCFLCKYF